MKKTLSMALVFIMLAGLLAGCASSLLSKEARDLGSQAVKVADEFISGKVESLDGRERLYNVMTELNELPEPAESDKVLQQQNLMSAVVELYLGMGETATKEDIKAYRKAIKDLL